MWNSWLAQCGQVNYFQRPHRCARRSCFVSLFHHSASSGDSTSPHPRLKEIAQLIQPKETIPATLEVWDIAGLVKGASQGEGLGNQFLSHIRNVDALIHVVRCFEDENIAHEGENIEPVRDIGIVNTELVLADIETLSRRLTKIEKLARVGEKQYREELEVLKQIATHLDGGIPVRQIPDITEMVRFLKEVQFLTFKPVLYVANVSEKEIKGGKGYREAVMQVAVEEKAPRVTICGKLEAELEDLGGEERRISSRIRTGKLRFRSLGGGRISPA